MDICLAASCDLNSKTRQDYNPRLASLLVDCCAPAWSPIDFSGIP